MSPPKLSAPSVMMNPWPPPDDDHDRHRKSTTSGTSSFDSHRLPDPHLTHQVRLFPRRSPQRSSANAAVGGLEPPPAGRLRRAYLHLPRSTASRSSTYRQPPSAFVTHHYAYLTVPDDREHLCHLAL